MYRDAPRVALVVGDTAGHTHPALAVADAVRARHADAHVCFLGTADSVAAGIILRAGHTFVPVPGSPIRRANAAGMARAARHTLRAIAQTRRLLMEQASEVAMGFGGFASGGVILGARSLGVPTVILEANVELGLANRWLRPWVRHVCQGLGRPESSAVGVPLRSAIVALRSASPRAPRTGLRVFVASGSRGADFFAARLPPVVDRLRALGVTAEVWQQASASSPLRDRYAAMGCAARVDTFVEDVAEAYQWADVVVARGGANTIAELAVAGLPAVLVPLADASANHQAANAQLWADTGAGVAIAEHAWRDDLVVAWLQRMATDARAYSVAAEAARRLARPDAAAQVAEVCLNLIRRRV